jgi:hypothetical protein
MRDEVEDLGDFGFEGPGFGGCGHGVRSIGERAACVVGAGARKFKTESFDQGWLEPDVVERGLPR